MNLRAHFSHSRRLRVTSPTADRRESVTLLSKLEQNGHFTALRLNAEDAWVRDVVIDETMNSVGINGRRITLQRVAVNRKARHQGSSKPAEFAPNASDLQWRQIPPWHLCENCEGVLEVSQRVFIRRELMRMVRRKEKIPLCLFPLLRAHIVICQYRMKLNEICRE